MRRLLLAGCILLALGCKRGQSGVSETGPQSAAGQSTPSAPTAVAPLASTQAGSVAAASVGGAPSSGWSPATKGRPINLNLTAQTLNFCDDSGPRQVSLATGTETAGTQACPKESGDNPEFTCNDQVEVIGGSGGGNDTINFEGANFPLKGLSDACAQAGHQAIVSTGEEVLLIDAAANTTSLVSHEGGDRVAIGGGWVAWRSLEGKDLLHVKAIAGLAAGKAKK